MKSEAAAISPADFVATSVAVTPVVASANHEVIERSARVSRIWREWLLALATDSEAAMAAALAYRQLSEELRDEWISTLDSDVDGQSISRVAVFAPLMAVETDPARRSRIEQLLQPELRDISPPGVEEYLQGDLDEDAVVSVIVSPLYLDFVQVLACAYVPGDRFLWVRHDPITCRERVAAACDALSGVELEPTPRGAVVDALARTVVAAHRRGDPLPEALSLFAHLFGAQL